MEKGGRGDNSGRLGAVGRYYDKQPLANRHRTVGPASHRIGARGRTRTDTSLRKSDFKPRAKVWMSREMSAFQAEMSALQV
jgi:hypothetical protein